MSTAPVRPSLDRIDLAMSRESEIAFIYKLFGLSAILTLGVFATLSSSLPAVGIVLIGVGYAHALELMHQTLHRTAFVNKKINRLCGFLLGLPLLVSFSHYRYSHMLHHHFLGTPKNREFFHTNGRRMALTDAVAKALFPSLMLRALHCIGTAVLGQLIESNASISQNQRIRVEYLAMGGIMVNVVIALIAFGSTAFLILAKVWLLPAILVAAPLNFFIELPEHVGCDEESRDVRFNTRTIMTNKFMVWFTVGNNFHTTHHLYPTAPFERLESIHRWIGFKEKFLCHGYLSFFHQYFFRRDSGGFK